MQAQGLDFTERFAPTFEPEKKEDTVGARSSNDFCLPTKSGTNDASSIGWCR